jgi:hypothetical protein
MKVSDLDNKISPIEKAYSEKELQDTTSIITILIISHGRDLPTIPFQDPNTRLISFAGKTGSVYYNSPTDYENIIRIFDDKEREYTTSLPQKGIKTFMKELYEQYPGANKCKKIPNFIKMESDNFLPQSTFEFLNRNIANGPHVDKYKSIIREIKTDIQTKGNSIPVYDKYTFDDADEEIQHPIHTPVINKLYMFTDPINSRIPNERKFGIYILDVCNNPSSAKIGDNLTTKKGYNKDFANRILSEGETSLYDLTKHLHEIGFTVINIIDISCRDCIESHTPRGTVRKRITELEQDVLRTIDRGKGRLRKTTRKTKRKPTKKQYKPTNLSII